MSSVPKAVTAPPVHEWMQAQPASPSSAETTLILEHQPLVRSLAWQVSRKLPRSVDIEDLIAFGNIGLTEAARGFDPARRCKFTTYAFHRVRGAIFDGLSKMSWFRLPDYYSSHYEYLANAVLRQSAEDSTGELSSVEAEACWLKGTATVLAVAHLAFRGPETNGLVDESTPSPETEAQEHDVRARVHELMDLLPGDAGNLVRSIYFEGLTLREAGARIGVSESWASRLHTRTLQRLAFALRQLGINDCDS